MKHDIRGNLEGETLFFIHGWPDNASLWKHQLPDLLEHYRCILITLPNFGDTPHEPGGCSVPQLMQRLEATIEELQPEGQVLFLAHDWGALFAYWYEKIYPQRVRRMVIMDVGGHVLPTPREGVFMVFYQWTLIFCWLVGGVSPALGAKLAKRFSTFVGATPEHVALIESRSIYIYFHFWKLLFFPWLSTRYLLFFYRPSCPILFLFGEKKPLRFHSNHWLKLVEQAGGKNVGFSAGDHWFMDTHIEEVNPLIVDWFAQESAS
jgi:cis-3-alkyl-4-acyloxetan-2-one decarboxylase